jgi:hypothetical protein
MTQMTTQEAIQLATAVGAIAGPLLTFWVASRLRIYKLEINSRMSELMNSTRALAHAEGVTQQRDKQDEIDAQRALGKAESVEITNGSDVRIVQEPPTP